MSTIMSITSWTSVFFSSVVVVVMMFWFVLIAKILIVGAVINASVQSLKDLNFRKD